MLKLDVCNELAKLSERLRREDEVGEREGRCDERGEPLERVLGLAPRRVPDIAG